MSRLLNSRQQQLQAYRTNTPTQQIRNPNIIPKQTKTKLNRKLETGVLKIQVSLICNHFTFRIRVSNCSYLARFCAFARTSLCGFAVQNLTALRD
jgi:hypothetical protein